MVCNRNLFLILTKYVFPILCYLFLVIQWFFIGIIFWTNFLESIVDRNVSIDFFCLVNPWILTEDLELKIWNWRFSSYPLMLLLLVTYFEQQNGSFYMQEIQIIKYDEILRKNVCLWEKNCLNILANSDVWAFITKSKMAVQPN